MANQILMNALDLLQSGKSKECEEALHSLLELEHETLDLRTEAIALDAMGKALFAQQRFDEGLNYFRKSVNILREDMQSSENTDNVPCISTLIGAMQNLFFALDALGNVEESMNLALETIALTEKKLGARSPRLAETLLRLSAVYYSQRMYDDAEKCLLRALDIWQSLPGEPVEAIGTCLNNLGRIYEERGEAEKGISYHKQAVAFKRKQKNREELAFSLGNLGVAYAQNADWQDAVTALSEAVKIYEEEGKGDSPKAQGYLANLQICQEALNNQ